MVSEIEKVIYIEYIICVKYIVITKKNYDSISFKTILLKT